MTIYRITLPLRRWLGASTLLALSFTATAQTQDIIIATPIGPWQLNIDTTLIHAAEARIEVSERVVARQIQSLLAKNQYQQVADLLAQRKMENDSAALLLLRGQVQLMLQRWPEAEKALVQALRKMPGLVKAHQGLSLLYMQHKDYDNAKRHLFAAIASGVADAQVYGQLAYIHLQQEQPWAAVAGYRQALFLNPENPQYQQGLLYALVQSGDLAQADALLRQQLNSHPADSALWLHRSRLALQQERMKDALASLEMALRLGDAEPQNHILAAQLHLLYGSPERSVAILQGALAKANDSSRKKLLQTAAETIHWLSQKQLFEPAQALYKQIQRLSKEISGLTEQQQAKWQLVEAQLAKHNGQLDKAKTALKKATQLDPTLGNALLALAEIYRDQGQVEQAKLLYVRAQALNDYRESALLGHAQLEIDGKNYRQALTLLKKALGHNPKRQDLIANIRALEKLVRHES